MGLSLKRIIWGIDAFDPSASRLEAAGALLSAIYDKTGAEIQPAYVLSPGELNLPLEYSGTLVERYLPNAQMALADAIEKLHLPKELMQPHVIIRETQSAMQAASALAEYADRMGADAIVVNTHGRSGFKRLLLGSFAETLLLESRCPVFVVPPEATTRRAPIGNIVFPTELRSNSKNSFTCAVELARTFGAKLALLHEIPHAIEPIVQSGVYLLGGGWIPIQDYYNEESDRKSRRAKAWARWAKGHGVETEAIVELGGVAIADRIIACAKERSADLIAMEAHSGRVASALIGSVVRQVVRVAPCPIWVLGPKATEPDVSGLEPGPETEAA
jgi:nucleotide-binding universal stress UspA family protein